MSCDGQKLYQLLPVAYRARDADQGGQLEALLSAIAEQIAVLKESLDQLYDDQFIETCADWVVPYIGDLVGTRGLHPVAPKILSGRAEVANTIAYRRRKGTAAMLEQLARDVTGWDARVVEFFQWLATTQFMNHIRPGNFYSPTLRDWELIEYLNTPFDTASHTADVRHIATAHGRYNIPNVGIFLWRIAAQPLTQTPAFQVDKRRFLFNPLGCNTQLFTFPLAEDSITHLAAPINVPAPISRRVLSERFADYFGPDKSLFLPGFPADKILICNLADADAAGTTWAHTPPPAGTVSIDPVLGRIAYGDDQPGPPSTTFHYGFSANMGGGEYERMPTFDGELAVVKTIASPAPIQSGLPTPVESGTVEIIDNARYDEHPVIQMDAGARLELRAANGHRPLVMLNADWTISGGAGSEVTLNGLVIAGGALRVPAANNQLSRLRLLHCTLVPGQMLNTDGTAQKKGAPSLIVEADNVAVEIDHCIVGALQVAETSHTRITDSIVDANDATDAAYSAPYNAGETPGSGAPLRVEETTLMGKVRTRILELASNSIFLAQLASGDPWPAPVYSDQKQAGCVRFCWLPSDSRVPRRYRCQPDLEIAQRLEAAQKAAGEQNRVLTQAEQDAIRNEVLNWLLPAFTSLHFSEAAYGQLSDGCPEQIRTGADDESEMGAFHDLFARQRETNLRTRLDEYLRFGLEAGIFHAT